MSEDVKVSKQDRAIHLFIGIFLAIVLFYVVLPKVIGVLGFNVLDDRFYIALTVSVVIAFLVSITLTLRGCDVDG